ncbi:S8 family serine peptidase [Halobacillus amylolyticus]|uniref:S8 family serine peptidase n=1 Tax=Halobacillus amylolyticus TaxID=2932259 RepID=A0ABY4HCW9_9BACI|nr:S8 family serine peptidase [Halobacillus amylolyticus]
MGKISALVLLLALATAGFSNQADPIQPTRPELLKDQPEPSEEVTIIVELDESPKAFASQIETRLPRLEIVATYTTIFQGVAIKGEAEELEKLARLDTVVNQYPVRTYTTTLTPQAEKTQTLTTDVVRSQTSFTGEGVKVGVIDTGVDYTHPDLTANYRGGFDVVDFDQDPMETMGQLGATMHGTHVSGIIAADGEMKGVAPDAELYVYRALGPGGSGSSVQVIAAIEQAVEEGMDVINLSLGNTVNGPDWPTTKAVNKAVELGTTVVVAAGNSGPASWTVGSPGTSQKAITVGAASLPGTQPVLTLPGQDRKVGVQLLQGSVPWTFTKKYPLIDGGTGENGVPPASGKIVVMKRGVVPFGVKTRLAYEQGAVGVIIYNNEEGQFQGMMNGKEIPIPVATVSKEDGEWLLEHGVEENQWLETTMKQMDHGIAPFSSRGPVTTNWTVKPDILAPGVQIISTVPGGYQPLQGTSMAAPHVAGVAALIKEAHPDWTPAQIKHSLMTTADLLIQKKGQPYPPTAQGAGYIDTEAAINPDLWIEPGALNFGRIKNNFFREKVMVTLHNKGDNSQTISVPEPESSNGITWMTPQTVELEPNEKVEVPIELSVSKAFVEAGVHQGYVTLKSDDQAYEIPYLFMMEGADYEKVSGFELYQDWQTSKDLSYRFHLTEAVDQLTVDLYRAGTMLHQGTLFELEEPEAGMVEGEVDRGFKGELGGAYIAVVTVTKDKKTSTTTFPVQLKNQQ